jgi:four helix bundle protein
MAKTIQSYRDLIVWQKSMLLLDEVDTIVNSFSRYDRYWLGMQMHRAALSIICNIAEGHSSEYRRVFLRQVSSSRASLREVETQLLVVQRRGYSSLDLRTALGLADEISRMLRALSERLRHKAVSLPPPP